MDVLGKTGQVKKSGKSGKNSQKSNGTHAQLESTAIKETTLNEFIHTHNKNKWKRQTTTVVQSLKIAAHLNV